MRPWWQCIPQKLLILRRSWAAWVSEDAQIKKVIAELTGKNIEELIAAGSKKLASVPSASAAPVASAGHADAAPAAAKKEEKKEEYESEDDDMGFGLFD